MRCVLTSKICRRGPNKFKKMRDIFWSAQRVLVLTGEPDDGDEALELLQVLGYPSTFMSLYGLATKPMAFLIDDFCRCWRKFKSLFRFLNRASWSRVWVVQEIAIPGSKAGDVGWLEKDKVQKIKQPAVYHIGISKIVGINHHPGV